MATATPTAVNRSLFFTVLTALGLAFSGAICLLYFKQMQSGYQIRRYIPSSSKEMSVDRGLAVSMATGTKEKPFVLLWFWPMGMKFDFNICKTRFDIDGCVLSDDRSLYSKANGVIIFHRNISRNLDNMPQGLRPEFQKWIWYNVDSLTNTARIPGLEDLFNLTMSYRRDASIPLHTEVLVATSHQDAYFVLPEKDKLACWIVNNNDPTTESDMSASYYRELVKHIPVQVYGAFNGTSLSYKEHYPTIGSCKFYLSFENSIHRDYITEKVNGPLVAGTVPVVLGPPRENYEQLIPGDSFIHVNDFPSASALANYLVLLDQKDESYTRYFKWRQDMKAEPHFVPTENEFIWPICLACDHMSRDDGHSVIHDLYN